MTNDTPEGDNHPYGIVPWTGETVDLTDTPKVVSVLDRIRLWKQEVLQPAIRQLEDAVVERMDAENRWTYRAGGLVASSSSPEAGVAIRYEEVPLLRARLAEAGMSMEAIDRLAKPTTTYRVDEREAKSALKNPRYQQILAEHRIIEPKRRTVTVKLDKESGA